MLNKLEISNDNKRKVIKQGLVLISTIVLMMLCVHVFAQDLLAGTDTDLVQTVKGTGKTYLYVTELIIATVMFIKSRDPKVFLGILALSVGFNVILKIAGL